LPLLANYGFFQYPFSSSMIIGAVLIIRSAPGVRLSWLILMKKGIGRVKQPCLKMLTSSIEGMDSEVSGGYSTDSLPREPMVPVLVWHFADAPFVVSMAIYPTLQSLGSLLNSLLIYQLPESVFLLINANGVFPGSGNCFR